MNYEAHAERFDFEVSSGHNSPWLGSQGHAACAWSVLGAMALVTKRVELTINVTGPTLRHHRAVSAQKAATMQLLADCRFILRLGVDENLNEHLIGEARPPVHCPRSCEAEEAETGDSGSGDTVDSVEWRPAE